MNILEENNATLRHKMGLRVNFEETSLRPSSISATNIFDQANAKILDDSLDVIPLMDLSGIGFRNDGECQPYKTGEISGRYGYISSSVADSNGRLANPIVITFESNINWEHVTLLFEDKLGNRRYKQYDTQFIGNHATVTIDQGGNNSRVKIIGAYLGVIWRLTEDNIISIDMSLRGATLDPEEPSLPVSDITIKVYEPNDFSRAIVNISQGTPVTVQQGYFNNSNVGPVRQFYLKDKITLEDNVMTLECSDSTYKLDGDFAGRILNSTYKSSRKDYVDLLKGILNNHNIEYAIEGSAPEGDSTTPTKNFIESQSIRDLFAKSCQIYSDDNELFIEYIDAGVPTLRLKNQRLINYTYTATNIINNINCTLNETPHKRVMDLAGIGFKNDGEANPIKSVNINGSYGLISNGIASSSGTLPSNVSVNVKSNFKARNAVVTLRDIDGNKTEIEHYNIVWINSQTAGMYETTFTFSKCDPNQRLYISDITLDNGWHLTDDDIGSMKKKVNQYVKSVSATVQNATNGEQYQESIDAEAGKEYWIDFSDPVYPETVSVSPATTLSVISPYKAKITANQSTTFTITATKILLAGSSYQWGTRPTGINIELENQPALYSDVSLMPYSVTNLCMSNILNTGTVIYEFDYRGNPDMQPRDTIYYKDKDGNKAVLIVESIQTSINEGGSISKIVARGNDI